MFQKLPSTDELLRQPNMQALVEREGHSAVAESIRVVLANLRQEIASGRIADGQIAGTQLNEKSLDLALGGLSAAVERQLRQSRSYSLRPLVNATGVILHTNLGRAPLAPSALDHARATASAYSNLEFDLSTGERGKRDVHVYRLFRSLLTADRAGDRGGAGLAPASAERSSRAISTAISTIVVNNNAAAVLLALNSLAEGGEVLVSRGELVEIGGSFRIPDVMSKSGAVLREVGTTNRTRIGDYKAAISERTRLLLRVHRSNFQIVGFTEQPSLEELVALGRKHDIPVMEDLGSGEIFDLRNVGVRGEPMIADSLRAGVDGLTYSGDKLLGGPQAGIISGYTAVVAKVRGNPLFRALRVDKMFYAALEATLLAYLREDYDAIPALRMLRLTEEAIGERAEQL